jgi:hypothetical protein
MSRPSAYVMMMLRVAASTKVIGGDGLCWLSSLFWFQSDFGPKKNFKQGMQLDQMTIPSARFNVLMRAGKVEPVQCRDLCKIGHARKMCKLIILVTQGRLHNLLWFFTFIFFQRERRGLDQF